MAGNAAAYLPVEAESVLFALAVPQPVDGYVSSDAEQPTVEFCGGLIGISSPVYAQEHFLGQLFGHMLRLHDAAEEPNERALMAVHEQGVSIGVAVTHPTHEFSIQFDGLAYGGVRLSCCSHSRFTFANEGTVRGVYTKLFILR